MINGGMGTYAEQLVKGLNEKRVDMHVITRGHQTCKDDKLHKINIPNVLYWRRLFFSKRAVSLFYRLNEVHNFDLVHLNGTYPIIRPLGVPTICTIHGPGNLKQMKLLLQLKRITSLNDAIFLFLKSPIGFLCDLGTVKFSDKIICPSTSLVENLSSRWDYIGGREKMVVIPNGIDLKQLDNVRSFPDKVLTTYGIEKDKYLLYMGRLSFLKGVDYLIEAFKKVQKKYPSLKLVIAGSGDFEPYLRKLSSHIKSIIFLGFVKSIRLKKILYEGSLAVVLPSAVFEISPMVIIEAMSYGKPVIATDVGGNRYLIKHGDNGFLSIPRDSENLAHFIHLICRNKALRKTMGLRGRILVEKKFTSDLMVNRTLNLYRSLLDR